ncbi:AraC family transcriptional regulator [Verrucomicrobiales bacterium]|nr:AraC family transcriptional regulator [Verrucomicrobiales bacterium]
MSKELQSILLEDFEITVPGFRLRRLALNQHMPRVEKLSEHVHDWFQALLYLRGYGVQDLDGRAVPVQRGSWLVIPPGCRHRFVKERTIRPVCLTIDFEMEERKFTGRREGALSAVELGRMEHLLVSLNEEESRSNPGRLALSALVLRIAALFELASTREESPLPGHVEQSVREAIRRIEFEGLRPGAVADEIGFSLDHLNRLLRAECNRTVGTEISTARLERASKLLRTTEKSIGEIASDVGIDDQNYFGRWFRKATGQTPTRWREAMRSV